jgi:NitT/TauT family transport system substrate-binding protein
MTTRFAAALAALLLAVAVPAMAQPATKLAVSYSATWDFMPTFVAKDAGIFDRHGLDVTLSNLATTALGPPALQAGSLQIASISPPLLLLANDGGLDLVAVASVGSLNAEHSSSSLITRPGLTVTKAQDLIGLKIGRPGINSAIDMLLKKWLLDRNVALDQVTLIETPFPQMGDRLRAGQLDAAVALEPIRSRIVSSGAGTRSIDFISQVSPHIVAAIYGSTREWATANLPALRAFRASLSEAMTYMRDNPKDADAIQQKYLGAASAPADLSLDLKPADFDLWIGIMKQLKLLQQPAPDAATLIVNAETAP